MTANTVTINGVKYDRHTGLPITKQPATTASQTTKQSQSRDVQHAHAVHHRTQKSKTLNRRYVQRTEPTPKPAATSVHVHTEPTPSKHTITRFTRSMDIAPAPKAPAKSAHTSAAVQRSVDLAPTVHPMVQRVAAAAPAKPSATVPKPSQILKQEAIQKSLDAATPAKHRRHREKAAKHPVKARRAHALRLATAGTALFLVAGYFTYLNMPNLSVRVAAAQAGINASYPSYRPSGYSLSGPVAFNDGQVSMKFAMNGTNRNFTLTQVKSSWDSSAVQSNHVIPAAGSNYDAMQVNGLTIYTYDNNAAWVNGNILYTITGDNSLTPDQIQRIATSL